MLPWSAPLRGVDAFGAHVCRRVATAYRALCTVTGNGLHRGQAGSCILAEAASKSVEHDSALPVCRRMTLLQADSVWEQYLEQTERLLTMRQYAVAVMGLMETSLQLQNLHHPWLALLRRPAANE